MCDSAIETIACEDNIWCQNLVSERSMSDVSDDIMSDGNVSEEENVAMPGHSLIEADKVDPERARKHLTTLIYEGSPSWLDLWRGYVENHNLTALDHIFGDTPLWRRVIWVFLVLTSVGVFAYQVYWCVTFYLTFPVVVNVKVNHNDTMRFPAVTICNLNAFRLTEVAKQSWYPFLSALYRQKGSAIELLRSHSKFPASIEQAFQSAHHRLTDFLISCHWGQQECSAEDFEEVLTSSGVCFTFNLEKLGTPARMISRTGSLYGLQLLLNVEQYEYMPGPQEGAGVKVLLHDQMEPPLVELGMAVPPGAHASAGVLLLQVRNLARPHGKCEPEHRLQSTETYSTSACLMECKTNMVLEKCRCKEFWMPLSLSEGVPACDITKYLSCVHPLLESEHLSLSHCSCPVPCVETIYDPVLTHARISNYDLDEFLRKSNARTIEERFVAAREASERIMAPLINDNTQQIVDMAHALTEVTIAMEKVEAQLTHARTFCTNLTKEMTPRTDFHLKTALDGVKYVVHNNFVRGWEVIDERTMQHVTTDFYEIINAYDRTLTQLRTLASSDPDTTKILYLMMEKDLSAKLELAIRSIDNITSAYYNFLNASPMFNYQYTPARRYDLALVPVDLLQNLTTEHKAYYENISTHLTGYMDCILTLKASLKQVYKTGSLRNQTTVNIAKEQFVHHSKLINYYRFLFSSRIVLRSEERVDETIHSFQKSNYLLTKTVNDVQEMVGNLHDQLSVAYTNMTGQLAALSNTATKYLHNSTLTKTGLSKWIQSHEIQDIVHSVKVLFRQIRSKANDLGEAWLRMRDAYSAIWRSILLEASTREFYRKLHQDAFDMGREPMRRDFYRHIFSDVVMLNLNESVASSMTTEEFMARMNADMETLNPSVKLADIIALFLTVMQKTNLEAAMGNTDYKFLAAFNDLEKSLKMFSKGNKIDAKFLRENFLRLDIFMRELSYEEFEQHAAYDVVKLLSDIGGSLGLFVGASVLSIFEIFDVCLHNACLRQHYHRKRKDSPPGGELVHRKKVTFDEKNLTKNHKNPNGRTYIRYTQDTDV